MTTKTESVKQFHTTESLVAIAQSYGLRCVEQAGNIRVEHADAPAGELAARRLYIAKQKRACTRVDIAGFGFIPATGVPGLKVLSEDEKFCKVNAQLDFTQPANVTLAAFHAACQAILGDLWSTYSDKQYTKLRQDARKAAAQRLKELLAAKPVEQPKDEELVQKVADEMGVEVSEEAAG